MAVSQQTFEELALRDPARQWELHRGHLREKPGMSYNHGHILTYLSHFLITQLDSDAFEVRANHGRLRHEHRSYYIPDVAVVPVEYLPRADNDLDRLEVYERPLPFVAEVWSPSTGDYDVESKIPEYQGRGDLEIWLLHPVERSLIAWRRQPDGTYTRTRYDGGVVEVASLAGVTIDLDRLLGWRRV